MEVTIVLFLHANLTRYFLILVSKGNLTPLLSYFLVKKIPLSLRVEYVMDGSMERRTFHRHALRVERVSVVCRQHGARLATLPPFFVLFSGKNICSKYSFLGRSS